MATGTKLWAPGQRNLVPWRAETKIYFPPKGYTPTLGLTDSPVYWVLSALFWNMKLTSHFLIVLALKMCGSMPPLHTS
jgi:hypothetical protein